MKKEYSVLDRRIGWLVSLIVGLVVLPPGWLQAENWPAWRGPNANGSVSSSDEFPTTWTPNSSRWKIKLPGKGGSTPIVWEGIVYLTSPVEGQDGLMAVELETGKVLWTKKLGEMSPPKHRRLGSSCNSSPVTDGESIFVYFRSGQFAAVKLDGTLRWSQNLTETFGPENLYWDQGSSPVVFGDTLLLTRMHAGESWIAAFNKKTGQITWREPRNYEVPAENDNGYTTPLLFSAAGVPAAMVWGSDHLTAYNRNSGSLLWSVDGFNPDETGFWPAISSPVITGETAIIPVGRDDRSGQAAIHGIRLGSGSDRPGAKRAWVRDDIGVFVPSLAEAEGRIYLLRNRGGVACLNPADGQSYWEDAFPRERTSYYASPVVANEHLYAVREDGMVFVAKVGRSFELLAENAMEERIVASPVPVDGHLLLRGDEHLFCFAKN